MSSSYLTKKQFRNFHEFSKIVMIRQNEHFMLNFFEIMTSMFENVNYNQKFFVINFIIVFNRNYFFEQINNKMLIIVLVLLRKNNFIKNKMIKRLIKYLVIERKIEYIQYENSLKSNNARNYINYSTLKTISIKISTFSFVFMF